ncbi:RluA family pseudouridine synthase [Thiofilum flexile]|uniref:RluA family pseudouridine synthase n=1 Tax=Thiofilum flexile TaxID=125627 RepID=UPI00037EE5DD|nr:RluA family pseudouridine synthase [Thiofilum flexile]
MTVQYHTVSEHEAGQRIDNFLLRYFKNVPKSVIYRIIRKGEVRVNKGRIKPEHKLALGEVVRIPPVKQDEVPQDTKAVAAHSLLQQIERAVIFEDEQIIALNKPAGIPVHGGTGHEVGLIEAFRQLRPNLPYVELVHRIDRDTSGVVALAKSREALTQLHALMREGEVDKRYQTLVAGQWQDGVQHITTNLMREHNAVRGHKMRVLDDDDEGKEAESIFTPKRIMSQATLMDVKILTGRMHQIRVQLAHLGYPILGDDRYGDFALNRELKALGLKRMFLHANHMEFILRMTGRRYRLEAPLPAELHHVLRELQKN